MRKTLKRTVGALVACALAFGSAMPAGLAADWTQATPEQGQTSQTAPAAAVRWTRLYGENRYATMESIVTAGFVSAHGVVICSGENTCCHTSNK